MMRQIELDSNDHDIGCMDRREDETSAAKANAELNERRPTECAVNTSMDNLHQITVDLLSRARDMDQLVVRLATQRTELIRDAEKIQHERDVLLFAVKELRLEIETLRKERQELLRSLHQLTAESASEATEIIAQAQHQAKIITAEAEAIRAQALSQSAALKDNAEATEKSVRDLLTSLFPSIQPRDRDKPDNQEARPVSNSMNGNSECETLEQQSDELPSASTAQAESPAQTFDSPAVNAHEPTSVSSVADRLEERAGVPALFRVLVSPVRSFSGMEEVEKRLTKINDIPYVKIADWKSAVAVIELETTTPLAKLQDEVLKRIPAPYLVQIEQAERNSEPFEQGRPD